MNGQGPGGFGAGTVALLAVLLLGCGSQGAGDATCGDGTLSGGEQCDDGNTVTETCIYGEQGCEVCDAECTLVPGETRYCGDGVVTDLESCDDSNGVAEVCPYGEDACTVCDGGCQLVPGLTSFCGDGDVDPEEACDDGNTVTENCAYGLDACTVCSAQCAEETGETATCGDGALNGEEECDLGDLNTVTCAYGEASCEVCSVYCSWIPGNTMVCGDGVRQGDQGEGCDDLDAPPCEDLGYDPGPTGCTLWCQVDSTTCTVGGVPRVQTFEAQTTGFSLPAAPAVALTEEQGVALTYLHASGGSTEVRVSREIAKGQWQTATVAWDGDAGRGPAIAAGPGASLAVAWPGEPASGLGERALWLARAPDGITWSAAEIAIHGPRDPAVALDPEGRATLAYYAFEGTTAARVLVQQEQQDGSWTQHALTEEGDVGDGMDLLIDAQGLPVVAYVHGTETLSLQVSRLQVDGTWSHAQVGAAGDVATWPALATRSLSGPEAPVEEVIVVSGGETGVVLAPDGGVGDWQSQKLVLFGYDGPTQTGVASDGSGTLHVSWTEGLPGDDGAGQEVLGLARVGLDGYYEKKSLFPWPDWSTQAADLQFASIVVRDDGEALMASTVILENEVVVVTEPPWESTP